MELWDLHCWLLQIPKNWNINYATTLLSYSPSINRLLYNLISIKTLNYFAWSKSYTREFMCRITLCNVAFYAAHIIQGRADKSLARPGRKQATATKLGIYSTYSPRSSIHFLARCSDFCKPPPKNSERCPSKQISAAVMTSASEEKWRPFNCFFSPGNSW